ncbi:TolC family protein [Algoriphagus kandeliae]|uniref:TolC family protein n=1 Tax=Algoriphagus kandeliae TaxID=2562278 RepID=A0A4Y9QY67_9BACT|nr:TolC family protein [Algoriphagus kandeliae]TFV97424.1 TolC family protein [Algoriphagus kandeliae]
MRKKILFFILFAISWSFSPGQSLDDYLVLAGENNPELKAFYQEFLAALEKAPQVGTLPDPELNAGIFFSPMERFMGNQLADIRLMQMFPWFGTLGTRKEAANLQAEARYQLFLDAKNKLFYEVKSTWFELYRIHKEIEINRENLEYLKEYERLALVKYSSSSNQSSLSDMSISNTGSGTQMSDILRIRMQQLELNNSILTLEDELIPLQIKFNQLLNRDIHEEISSLDTLEPTELLTDKMVLLDSIQASNPILANFDAQYAALEQEERMARLEGRPMLGAGIDYMPFQPRTEGNMMIGGRDMIMPMVSISLPIYRKKTDSKIKETELLRQATLLRKEKEQNMLAMEWANAIRDLENANRKIQLYQEQKEIAKQTLKLLTTSFTANGNGLEDVLAVQQQLLDFQLKEINAIVIQHQSLAKLESLLSNDISSLN